MTTVDSTLPAGQGRMVYGNALGLASMVIWAMAFPAAEILLVNWEPMTMTFLRFALSMLFLVPLWVMLEGFEKVRAAPWLRGLIIGGPTFGIAPYLLLLSQDLTDAVTAAILVSTLPIVSALIEVVMGERRLGGMFVFGLALSFFGAWVATGSVDAVPLGWGALIMLASVILFAVGSYLSVRNFPEVPSMGHTALPLAGGFVVTSVILLVMYVLGLDVLPKHRVEQSEIAAIVVYALAGMAISQLLWVAAIAKIGVAISSFHVNATPFYVMLFMLAFGETWDWQRAFGAAIVITGVIVAQMRGRPRFNLRAAPQG